MGDNGPIKLPCRIVATYAVPFVCGLDLNTGGFTDSMAVTAAKTDDMPTG